MKQPFMLTPDGLRAELRQRGYRTSKRWILEGVRKGLLPQLSDRGRGQKRGKSYYWSDPAVIEQAVAIYILRRLKYPTSVVRLSIWLIGFPCGIAKVRSAWLSRIERIAIQQALKAKAAKGRARSQFNDFEDQASELSLPIAKAASKVFGMDKEILKSATLEIYVLVFGDQPLFAVESVEYLLEVAALIAGLERVNFGERDLAGILRFFQGLTWASVYSSAKDFSNDELEVARQQWQRLVALLTAAFPMLRDDMQGLRVVDYLSIKLGAICLAPFLKLIREGKRRELNITLDNIAKFVETRAIPKSLPELQVRLNSDPDFARSLTTLVNELSAIWRYGRFPFSAVN